MKSLGRWVLWLLLAGVSLQVFFVLRVALMVVVDPHSTAFMRSEAWRVGHESMTTDKTWRWSHQWVADEQLSPHLKRAVIASEDAGFTGHGGVDWEAIEGAWQKNERRQQLAELMPRLQAWAQAQASVEQLPNLHAYPWVLRFFLCDRHGTQLTPNLEWHGQHWHVNNGYQGHNWSWRPYFYHLLAEGWDERRLILSSTYRDATTNQYCLTAGQFIANGQRLLLLDIDAAGL